MVVLWVSYPLDSLSITPIAAPLEDEEISSEPQRCEVILYCLSDLGLPEDGGGPVIFQTLAVRDQVLPLSDEQFAQITLMVARHAERDAPRSEQTAVQEHVAYGVYPAEQEQPVHWYLAGND